LKPRSGAKHTRRKSGVQVGKTGEAERGFQSPDAQEAPEIIADGMPERNFRATSNRPSPFQGPE